VTDGTVSERRRQQIQERINGGPSSGVPGRRETDVDPDTLRRRARAVACHYCGEEIGVDEAERCHRECEKAWRDLVTGERGERP